MGMLKLSNGFSVLPEGETILYVTGVDYDEKWGKFELHFINADGNKHSEHYKIYKDNGDMNEGALNAFSWIARTLLNDPSAEEIKVYKKTGNEILTDCPSACYIYIAWSRRAFFFAQANLVFNIHNRRKQTCVQELHWNVWSANSATIIP